MLCQPLSVLQESSSRAPTFFQHKNISALAEPCERSHPNQHLRRHERQMRRKNSALLLLLLHGRAGGLGVGAGLWHGQGKVAQHPAPSCCHRA